MTICKLVRSFPDTFRAMTVCQPIRYMQCHVWSFSGEIVTVPTVTIGTVTVPIVTVATVTV